MLAASHQNWPRRLENRCTKINALAVSVVWMAARAGTGTSPRHRLSAASLPDSSSPLSTCWRLARRLGPLTLLPCSPPRPDSGASCREERGDGGRRRRLARQAHRRRPAGTGKQRDGAGGVGGLQLHLHALRLPRRRAGRGSRARPQPRLLAQAPLPRRRLLACRCGVQRGGSRKPLYELCVAYGVGCGTPWAGTRPTNCPSDTNTGACAKQQQSRLQGDVHVCNRSQTPSPLLSPPNIRNQHRHT